jgi:hypothetical protein
MINQLDKRFSGFSKEYSSQKSSRKSSVSFKVADTVSASLDHQLNEIGFSTLQREYVERTSLLYPSEKNSFEEDKADIINNTQSGLLVIRNEVYNDLRLSLEQKDQLYNCIDMQYATLESVFGYVEREVAFNSINKRWKISFKKIVNIVVSVVLTTVISAAVAAIKVPSDTALIIGGSAGFVSGVISATKNSCIKICGTGYCDTSYNDCYSSSYLTFFTLKYGN